MLTYEESAEAFKEAMQRAAEKGAEELQLDQQFLASAAEKLVAFRGVYPDDKLIDEAFFTTAMQYGYELRGVLDERG